MSEGTRKVTVGSALSNAARVIDTDAKTWGELKKKIKDQLPNNVEAILSANQPAIKSDDFILPEEDFKIFLVPVRNKAGNEDVEALAKEITNAIRYYSSENEDKTQEDLNALKLKLITNIQEFFLVPEGEKVG